MIRVDRTLRRCWVFGRRVHHADFGAMLIAAGAVLMWHDRADRSAWLRFTRL